MIRRRLLLASLLVATLAVKAAVLAQLCDHPLLQPHGELDTAHSIELAQKIATGGPLAITDPLLARRSNNEIADAPRTSFKNSISTTRPKSSSLYACVGFIPRASAG